MTYKLKVSKLNYNGCFTPESNHKKGSKILIKSLKEVLCKTFYILKTVCQIFRCVNLHREL